MACTVDEGPLLSFVVPRGTPSRQSTHRGATGQSPPSLVPPGHPTVVAKSDLLFRSLLVPVPHVFSVGGEGTDARRPLDFVLFAEF